MITRFVTSLSINRQERQHFCLASWKRFGLPIIAVATENQAEQLMETYPEVDDWEIQPERPNAWDRPYLVRIADHIALAAESTILLINSDIEIRDTEAQFRKQWFTDDPNTLICGIRWEHHKGDKKRELNPYGIDAFRITPEIAAAIQDAGFTIGVPGWDYWLPWELWRQGFDIRAAESLFMHEIHEMGYSKEAVAIAYDELYRLYRMPGKVISVFIQHVTGREGTRRTLPKPRRR